MSLEPIPEFQQLRTHTAVLYINTHLPGPILSVWPYSHKKSNAFLSLWIRGIVSCLLSPSVGPETG